MSDRPFGRPPSSGAPRPKSSAPRRSPTVILAALLFVGGIVAVVIGMVTLVAAVIGVASDGGARRDAIIEIDVPGEGIVDLEARSYVALALGEGLVVASYDSVQERVDAVRGPFAAPLVVVTGPDGMAVELRTPRVETLEDRPGTDAASIVELAVRSAGVHTVAVEPAPGSTEGAVTSVILRRSGGVDSFGLGDFVLGFVVTSMGAAAVMVGVLIGVMSLVRGTR
jgi:hypothetical protein